MHEKKERMKLALQELEKVRETKSGEEKKEARASMTDPDARIMKQSDGGFTPAYNLLLSNAAARGINIGVRVSRRSDDTQELIPAITTIEENFGETPGQVIADGGYTSCENVEVTMPFP